jgi:hypothetical protein
VIVYVIAVTAPDETVAPEVAVELLFVALTTEVIAVSLPKSVKAVSLESPHALITKVLPLQAVASRPVIAIDDNLNFALASVASLSKVVAGVNVISPSHAVAAATPWPNVMAPEETVTDAASVDPRVVTPATSATPRINPSDFFLRAGCALFSKLKISILFPQFTTPRGGLIGATQDLLDGVFHLWLRGSILRVIQNWAYLSQKTQVFLSFGQFMCPKAP